MFYEGQKVRIVDDTDWGKVLKVEDDRILVRTNHGFENYYRPDQIVPEAGKQAYTAGLNSKEAHQKMVNDVNQEKVSIKSKGVLPEIDLHIENLLENWQKMSNYDILQYQMRYFRKKLEGHFERKTPRLIIIHGRGEGVLRGEIRTELMKYPNIEFLDGSYLEYGIGATEVRIRYNF